MHVALQMLGALLADFFAEDHVDDSIGLAASYRLQLTNILKRIIIRRELPACGHADCFAFAFRRLISLVQHVFCVEHAQSTAVSRTNLFLSDPRSDNLIIVLII